MNSLETNHPSARFLPPLSRHASRVMASKAWAEVKKQGKEKKPAPNG